MPQLLSFLAPAKGTLSLETNSNRKSSGAQRSKLHLPSTRESSRALCSNLFAVVQTTQLVQTTYRLLHHFIPSHQKSVFGVVRAKREERGL